MVIKVLGSGCANCKKLEQNVSLALQQTGLTASIEKVSDYADILAYGVSSTPALVVDEKLVLAGRVASPTQIASLLQGS